MRAASYSTRVWMTYINKVVSSVLIKQHFTIIGSTKIFFEKQLKSK